MRSVSASSPTAGRPFAPRGFGVPHVPEASITATARCSTMPWGVCTRRTNGASSHPWVLTLSKPTRLTCSTRLLRCRPSAIEGSCDRGAKYSSIISPAVGKRWGGGAVHPCAARRCRDCASRLKCQGREELHVAIALQVRSDGGAGLEHERSQATPHQMRGGGQSHWTRTNHGDREIARYRSHTLLLSVFADLRT
jgi:hypothetical protein